MKFAGLFSYATPFSDPCFRTLFVFCISGDDELRTCLTFFIPINTFILVSFKDFFLSCFGCIFSVYLQLVVRYASGLGQCRLVKMIFYIEPHRHNRNIGFHIVVLHCSMCFFYVFYDPMWLRLLLFFS